PRPCEGAGRRPGARTHRGRGFEAFGDSRRRGKAGPWVRPARAGAGGGDPVRAVARDEAAPGARTDTFPPNEQHRVTSVRVGERKSDPRLHTPGADAGPARSEERRVGKEATVRRRV